MIRIAYTFATLFFAALSPLRADTTGWVEVQGGAVRLITSGPLQDGHYLAGLEFMLEPGWHTYWRYPGEAGIPPQITFTDTKNLKELEVLYPVPERYSDGFSESIVYHDGIVLPIRITPEDAEQNVHLAIDLFFGICNDICVPGDAALSMMLTPAAEKDKLSTKLIDRDLANVPRMARDQSFQINSVKLTEQDKIEIEASVPERLEPDLFVAGPEGSFIGLPELTVQAEGRATWQLSTKGLKATKEDRQLRLVLTVEDKSIEHLEPIQPDWVN